MQGPEGEQSKVTFPPLGVSLKLVSNPRPNTLTPSSLSSLLLPLSPILHNQIQNPKQSHRDQINYSNNHRKGINYI